jgi:leader peptidase (prepilin peptidase)/N-methyltransferase
MVYINDIHILFYVLFAFIGGFIGQVIDYLNIAFLNERKVISKESFKKYKETFKVNYKLIVVNSCLYVALLYKFGMNLDFLRFAILTPMLISAFIVDYKIQIIPNRLNFTMFEVGIIFAFIFGIQNLNLAKDMFLGMIAGGGIFLLITLIGGLIAGKEAMGLGDVKLMGALGLFFGWYKILIISVLAFLIGAIISIIVLIVRKNREDGYIPFGPFIVVATFITIFVPTNLLFISLMKVFSLGLF